MLLTIKEKGTSKTIALSGCHELFQADFDKENWYFFFKDVVLPDGMFIFCSKRMCGIYPVNYQPLLVL